MKGRHLKNRRERLWKTSLKIGANPKSDQADNKQATRATQLLFTTSQQNN